MIGWIYTICAVLLGSAALAEEVAVAVASNFATTAAELASAFEAETGHTLVLTEGASGAIFAEIVAGSEFDIFLSADADRPAALVAEGVAQDTGTYALGQLALVSRIPVDAELVSDAVAGRTVALADPTMAPYGKASTLAMERLQLDTATFQPVVLANVGQVAGYFASGQADLAFVAASQVAGLQADHVVDLGEATLVLQQDAALLNAESVAAQAFWNWLFSARGQSMIVAAGYTLP